MKYFSKLLSMFLVGMVLVSVGCTDYDEQIRDLHNKIDENQTNMTDKVDAEISALETRLDQVKADLEAALEAMKNELSTKHKEDVDALKAIDAELDGKITEANKSILALEGELAKEVSRLEGEIDTLEAALEAAKKELAAAIKAGDDAVKTELTKKITDLETSLLAKIKELQTKLEGDIENLRKDMQGKVDAANTAIAEANKKIDALDIRVGTLETDVDAIQKDITDIEKEIADNKAALEQAIKDGDAAVKAELEAKIAALESELKDKIAALEAQDKKFAEQLKEIEENLNALSDRVTANYNELKADLAALETKLQAQIDANKRAIEENALDIVALQAQAEEIIESVDNVRNYVVNVEKSLIAHIEAFGQYQTAVNAEIAAINAHLVVLDEQIAAIQALLPEMQAQIDENNMLAQKNAAEIAKNAALFEAFKNATLDTLDQLMAADVAINTAIGALGDDITALEGDLAVLAANLEDYKVFVEGQLEDCFAAIATVKGELEDSIAALKAQHTKDLTSVLAQTTAIWAELANYKTLLDTEANERKAEDRRIIDMLNNKYNELDSKYDARCNELNEAIVKLEKDFMLYQAQIQAMLNLAIENLKAEILAAEKRANEYTDVEVGELKDYTDTLVGDLKVALNERIDEVEDHLNDVEDALISFQGIMNAQVARLDSKIDGVEKTLTDRIAALEALETEHYGELKKEISDNYNDLKGLINGINTQLLAVWAECSSIRDLVSDVKNSLLDEIAKAKDELNTEIDAVRTELKVAKQEIYDTINEKVAELQAQIDELVNRIQSIVPVPEYGAQDNYIYALCDYGATLDYYGYPTLNDDTLLSNGGIFRITYRITPAEAASQIVEYCKKDMSILHFAVEDLTRHEVKDGAKIMDVVLDKTGTGRIVVTGFLPTSDLLKERFASTDSNVLAVALVFNNEKVAEQEHKGNIVSNFTNLFAKPVYLDKNPIVLEYTNGNVITNSEFTSDQTYYNVVDTEYFGLKRNEIKYDDTDRVVTIFEGWEPRLAYDKELDGTVDAYYTVEEFAQEVFGLKTNNQFLPEFVINCGHTYEDKLGLALVYDNSNFVLTEAEEGYNDKYSVNEPLKAAVGNVAVTALDVAYAGAYTSTFGEEVEIVKSYFTVNMADVVYNWNFADYKTVRGTDPANVYEGNNVIEFKSNEVTCNLTQDIKDELTATPVVTPNLVTLWNDVNSTYTVKDDKGNAVTGVVFTPVALAKDGENYTWTFTFSGWEFGKKYTVSVKNASYDEYDVVFNFTIQFVDLPEAISHTCADIELEYDNTLASYTNGTTPICNYAEVVFAENEVLAKHFKNAAELAEAICGVAALSDGMTGLKLNPVTKRNGTDLGAAAYNWGDALGNRTVVHVNNNEKLTVDYKVMKGAITSEKDVFELSSVFTPVWDATGHESTIKFDVNVKVTIKMPEYFVINESLWTAKDEKSYYADVKGLWTPGGFNLFDPENPWTTDAEAINSFSTQSVKLTDCFNIYKYNAETKTYGLVEAAEIAAQAITMEFAKGASYYANKYGYTGVVDDQIVLNSDWTLNYMDKADYIFINGTLKVNGITISDGFDKKLPAEEFLYTDNFRVNKYDPIAEWNSEVVPTIQVPTNSSVVDYTTNVFKGIALLDKRGIDIVDHNTTNANNPWILGNGTNGFVAPFNAGWVFSISSLVDPEYGVTLGDYSVFKGESNVKTPAMDSYITYSKTTGAITFSNLNNIKLQENLRMVIPVEVNYPWGYKTGKVVIEILK